MGAVCRLAAGQGVSTSGAAEAGGSEVKGQKEEDGWGDAGDFEIESAENQPTSGPSTSGEPFFIVGIHSFWDMVADRVGACCFNGELGGYVMPRVFLSRVCPSRY